jgi:hypothetical protein
MSKPGKEAKRKLDDAQKAAQKQAAQQQAMNIALAHWNEITGNEQYASVMTCPPLDSTLRQSVPNVTEYIEWEGGGYAPDDSHPHGYPFAIPQSLIDNAIASFGGNVPPYVNPPGWPS